MGNLSLFGSLAFSSGSKEPDKNFDHSSLVKPFVRMKIPEKAQIYLLHALVQSSGVSSLNFDTSSAGRV